MAGRKEPLTTGEYYHVYNRGVDRRVLFRDKKDYGRFLMQLYAFNDFEIASNYAYYAALGFEALREREREEPLVGVVAFCLMPNHYHLVLRQLRDDGISLYMQKAGAGYAKYFNLKYERTGALFESRFKAKCVDDDSYLYQIVPYVHANPLGISAKIDSSKRDFRVGTRALEKYTWSSYPVYLGRYGEGDVQYDVLDHRLIQELGLPVGRTHLQQIQKYLSSPEDDRNHGWD